MDTLVICGGQFGKLTVMEYHSKDRSGYKYRCRCECGKECVVCASKLKSGHTKSCGCSKHGNRPSAIRAGQKYNRLTAIEFLRSDCGRRLWRFACDCATEHVAAAGPVKFGQIKSCGCLFSDKIKLPRPGKHKMIRTPEYRTWSSMHRRCRYKVENPRHGGRGITVCQRWSEFASFYADMGPRPRGCSLDRIDNDGNYEPSNCRWATPKQQANNRQNSKTVSVNGEEVSIADASLILRVPTTTLYWRLKNNRPLASAA